MGQPASDQVPMPAEQSIGLDEEPPPMSSAEEPTETGEQRPIAVRLWRPG
jgi:hypothetical protein